MFRDTSQKYIYIPPSPPLDRKLFTTKKLYNNIDSTRYFVLGVVEVLNPLLKKNKIKGKQFCLYDKKLNKVLCFDVDIINEDYIMNGDDLMRTKYGDFALSEEARQMIIKEMHIDF
jgi:hypothetical protein